MEEVIYFNADFEKQLFSQSRTRAESNRLNQELEYLLFFIEPNKIVFTIKDYPKDYLEFVFSISGIKPSVTRLRDVANPWFGNYHQLDLKMKWQNKLEFFKFLEKHQFNLAGSKIISHGDHLKNGFLYKRGDQMSGRGHLLFPKDKKTIEGYLKSGGKLLREPLIKRSFDYSFLLKDGKLIAEYINEIDDLFQYKGTSLGFKTDINSPLRKKIDSFLILLKKELFSYKEEFSLDSYFFENSEGELDWTPCELNLRKTMGYIALKLKTLYFSQFPFFILKISTSNCDHLYKKRGEDYLCLSPLGNRFFIIAVAGKTETEVQNRLKKLLF